MSVLRGDVAIIGMSCIFPGAPDLLTYWQNIVSKVDAVSDPPPEWGADLFYDPDSRDNDRIYCKRGGYLKQLAAFDPLRYGVMPSSVDGGEPDHFLALRVAYEALADAGYLGRTGERGTVEVILGRGTYTNRGYTNLIQHGLVVEQTLQILKRLHPEHNPQELQAIRRELKASLPPFNAEMAPGLIPNIVSGRIANRLDLMGSSYIVDAACASSLIAVEHGCQDLLARKCDLAIVGGVHASTPPPILMIFCQLSALSRRGQIRPFDKDADGTLLGEGVGMVVLKRREDAERDGDRIYALIKGIGTSSDGRALGLLTPRIEGEELALRRAYESAGISPDSVELIEAHGTGTPVGDVTEIQALSRVFGPRRGSHPSCAVGTVKSMISHLIPAAGVAGLIKTALALYQKVHPPSLNCDEPNPKFELEKTPFYINTETRPWIHPGPEPRRAGVNAFGFGGINAHAILEENTAGNAEASDTFMHHWDSEVLILQADTRADLISRAKHLLRFLSRRPSIALKDLAYTLNCPLRSDGLRLAIVATSLKDLEEKVRLALRRLADPQCQKLKDRSGIFFFEKPLSREGTLAFLFPGQGSHYVNMLADLCLHFPEVRRCFDHTDRVFCAANRDVLPSQALFPADSPRLVPQEISEREPLQVGLAVATVLTANRALFDLLDRLEMRPAAIAGHSSGELAALLASGALDVQDEDQLLQHGLELNRIYESLSDQIPPAKLMTVGAADPAVVATVVAEGNGDLHVTMDNCPHQVILCGTEEAMARTRRRLQARGAICTLLPFERPYHSHLFRPICDRLAPFFERLSILPPRTTLYSCATARPYPQDPAGIRHLAVEQWARPVRFRETIEAMYADGVRIFVEVGPRGNLTSFVEDILQGQSVLAVPSNLPGRSGITQLNILIGLLAAHGLPMRLDKLYARRAPCRVSLEASADRATSRQERAEGFPVSLELPRLHLAPRKRAHPSQAPTGSASKTSPRTQPRGRSTTEDALPHQTAPVAHLPASCPRPGPPASSAPAASPLPVPEIRPRSGPRSQGSPRSLVMQAYMQTMDRFLETQRVAISAFIAQGRAPAPQGNRENSHHQPHPQGNLHRQALQVSRGPFRMTVSSMIPDKELIATCQLDLEEHLFLLDHALGRQPSALDDTLTGLPIVPLTMSMEIMAQAAAALHPDKKFLGMKAVRAHRWIVVEEEPVALLVTAETNASLAPGEVAVKIHEGDRPEGSEVGRDRLFAEGIVVFGTEYPAPPVAGAFPLRSERPFRYPPSQVYREVLFHGPVFQCIRSIDRTGEDGIEATLAVLPADGLFRTYKNPRLLTDPVLLDGVGALVGTWACEALDSGFIAFPIGLEALAIYGPWPPPSELLKCYARISLPDAGRVRGTIEVVGTGGQLLARVAAWEDIRLFDWSRQFHRLGLMPREVMLSAPWPSPVSPFPVAERFRCCQLSETGDGIWARALAHFVLTRRERKIWSQLPGPERRRREWLLGRLAAKDAVRLLLKERHQVELCPADIEIVTDEHGRPGVTQEFMERTGCRISLSIAHAGGVAVGLAGDVAARLGAGIDVEPMDRNHDGLERVALTADEQALLVVIPPSEKDEWVLRLWCAKEAVAKAIGRGMLAGPLSLVVQRLDVETGQVTVGLTGELARQLPASAGNLFTAHTGREDNFVFASSLA